MKHVPTYRVELRREATLKVAEESTPSFDAAGRVALAWFRERAPAGEILIVILLDGRNRVRGIVPVSQGGAHGCAITPADIFRPAIAGGAAAILLAHNHPSEDPTPSNTDLHMTAQICSAGDVLGIPVLDHLVIAIEAGLTRSCKEA
jgi:DNA repair protein RadC